MPRKYSDSTSPAELSESVVTLLNLNGSCPNVQGSFYECSNSMQCPKEVENFLNNVLKGYSVVNLKSWKSTFVCKSSSKPQSLDNGDLIADLLQNTKYSGAQSAGQVSESSRATLQKLTTSILGLSDLLVEYKELKKEVESQSSNEVAYLNPLSYFNLSSTSGKIEKLKKQMKKIKRARLHNAELYNRFMCLKTLAYLVSSETQITSLDGYFQEIHQAKYEVNESDPLKDHPEFGLALTKELNPQVVNPPNFFVFDFDATMNFSMPDSMK